MATLETMPRDAAQHIFRLAFFRDYASLSVRQLKFLLKDRDVSIDGVVEKHELVNWRTRVTPRAGPRAM
jgi:hypothetical protein